MIPSAVEEIFASAYWQETLRDLIRLFAAFALAFPIAWDRERTTHIMGMRTFSLVALGACAYVLIAEHFIPEDAHDARARILQGLLSGIGFLGAGAIIKRRDEVKGTATAACIWMTGALGAAAGHGEFALAVILSAFTYVMLKVLSAVHSRYVAGDADEESAPTGDRERPQ